MTINALPIGADYTLRLIPETNTFYLGQYVVVEQDEKGRDTQTFGIFQNRETAVSYANRLLAEEEAVSGFEHERFI